MALSSNRIDTFTYKKVGELGIKIDVHRRDDDRLRPVAVWIHGGALMGGRRRNIGRAGEMLLEAGYCVVSIDYRLAPETKLPEIVADLEDAFIWIRENAHENFLGDTAKIAVLGNSAGGHLTLTSGFRVNPRPDVLVAFWGYGYLIGPWLSEPSAHQRHREREFSEADAVSVLAGPSVANSAERTGYGGGFYHYCRQRGIWPRMVSGFDPESEAARFDPYMAAKNVTPEYPPTLLIHGAEDTDVPHQQSEIMARALEQYDVTHRIISVAGGEHGLAGADSSEIDAAYAAVLPFIAKYVPALE